MPRSCAAVQKYFNLVDRWPQYRRTQMMLDAAARTSARMGMQAAPVPRKIPVVVHVVLPNPNIVTDAQIGAQVEALNRDYNCNNKDIGTVPGPFKDRVGKLEISFSLATKDPKGKATNGITRRKSNKGPFTAEEDAMKAQATGGTDPWDTARYLNLWVCELVDDVLGYAQFPGGPPETDGVVILHSAFGTGGSADSPFDLGRTAVHEVGHFLNLSHIWGESRIPDCVDSDFVEDTPNQLGPNSLTPSFPTISCSNGPHGDMFMNYMDYVDDAAMVMFTKEQCARMWTTLDMVRSQLGTDDSLIS
jgi:hypothetical protein